MANITSQHILGTSSNLLGFCLVLITSLHIAQQTESTRIDEYSSAIAILFAFSSILSFASIRTNNAGREKVYETTAEVMFIIGLIGIAAIIIFIAVTFWNK